MSLGERYQQLPMRRCGSSGVLLPSVTLGLWQNFGIDRPYEQAAELIWQPSTSASSISTSPTTTAPPTGTPKSCSARSSAMGSTTDDELLISTKAGYDMWDGPFGEGGSGMISEGQPRRRPPRRMGLEYVDIFYSHRFDPDTPLEETVGALADSVHVGKALCWYLVLLGPPMTEEASTMLEDLGVPLLIGQFRTRFSTAGSKESCWTSSPPNKSGAGSLCWLEASLQRGGSAGVPDGSRATKTGVSTQELVNQPVVDHAGWRLSIIFGASDKGRTLAQMAISWVLRDPRLAWALIGASSVIQLEENTGAADAPQFTDDELATRSMRTPWTSGSISGRARGWARGSSTSENP